MPSGYNFFILFREIHLLAENRFESYQVFADVKLYRHAVNALPFNQPAMSVSGILFSVLKVIGENQHMAGDADAIGLKLFLITIKPAIAALAILVKV
jgi:hypothetical protein